MVHNDKQLYLLSGAFVLVFLAFSTTQSLESSLNPGSIGTASLGTIYWVLTVSSFCAPWIIDRLGVNLSMTAGFSTYVLFIASNLYVKWWTMLPAAFFLGIGAAVLWAAQGTYLSALCPTSALASRASGIFFGIYQSGQLFGNLIAFGVLSTGSKKDGGDVVPQSTTNLLFLLFTLSACCGTFLSKFLKDFSELGEEVVVANEVSIEENLEVDAHLLRGQDSAANQGEEEEEFDTRDQGVELTILNILSHDSALLWLVPLFFYSGLEQTFAWGEFTAHVVKPLGGEDNVPLAMAMFGTSNALFSVLLGKMANTRRATRYLLFSACIVQMAVVGYVWHGLDVKALKASTYRWPLVLFLALLLGYSDASLNTLITALLAARYRAHEGSQSNVVELAFAQFKMWQSLSTGAAFFYSSHFALDVKCAITVITGVFGLLGLVRT
mmetsp:Transcript_107/g.250  ORF Transcript_107/g.250 Transcript_107/m.250 type:complete len:439 (+) Transcript_107:677-1993(+)